MVKYASRRYGYRKTYRPRYRTTYKPKYRSNYRYRKTSKYRKLGRHRISSKVSNISKTFRSQKNSKILSTDVNVNLVPDEPFVVFNGKYLKTSEIGADPIHIYAAIASKLPTTLYSRAYAHLTSDSGIVNPTLKLKDTRFTCISNSTAPVSIISLHDPILSHFQAAKDFQKLFRLVDFPDSYIGALTIITHDAVNGTFTSGVLADLNDANLANGFRTYINTHKSEFIEHFISVLVGVDPKSIFKQVILVNLGANTFRSYPVDYYRMVPNKLELKRVLARAALSDSFAGDGLENSINVAVNMFSGAWNTLFDTVYTNEYPGITSACLGLNDNEKRVFTQWISAVFKFSFANNAGIDRPLSYYLEHHKTGDLGVDATSATNAIAALKLITIRHLYGDKPTLYEYKPTKNPNLLIISSHGSAVPVRIRQDYKFSSVTALRSIRLALYNNPDMMSYLSDPMRDYINSAFPELRLYKEGQKSADRQRRLGRQ